jgi:hypothetical protein
VAFSDYSFYAFKLTMLVARVFNQSFEGREERTTPRFLRLFRFPKTSHAYAHQSKWISSH